MTQKNISRWFKLIIIVMSLLAFSVLGALSLIFLVSEVEEISAIKTPWLIFIWATAVPLIPAIISSWSTAKEIGKGNPFCKNNSRNLHRIAVCAGVDSALVFAVSIAFLVIPKMSVFLVFAFSMIIVCIGVAITICAEGLSQLIKNATSLQEDSDLTI